MKTGSISENPSASSFDRFSSESGPATIQAALPASDDWFNETAFQISAESGNDFKAIACTIRDHTVAILVPDVLSGDLYPYIELNKPYTKAATVTALYSDASGKPREKIIPEFVKTTSLPNVLSRGAAGNTVILRASMTGTDGYDQSVDLTLRLDRMPTLASLRVTNAAETAQAADKAFSPTDTEYTYQIVDTAKELRIYPTAMLTGSSITISSNGTDYPLDEKGGAAVPVNGNTDVTVSVKNGAYETAYTLHIQPGKGQSVKPAINVLKRSGHSQRDPGDFGKVVCKGTCDLPSQKARSDRTYQTKNVLELFSKFPIRVQRIEVRGGRTRFSTAASAGAVVGQLIDLIEGRKLLAGLFCRASDTLDRFCLLVELLR